MPAEATAGVPSLANSCGFVREDDGRDSLGLPGAVGSGEEAA